MREVRIGAITYKSQTAAIKALLKRGTRPMRISEIVGCTPTQVFVVRKGMVESGELKRPIVKVGRKKYRNKVDAIRDLLNKKHDMPQKEIAERVGSSGSMVSIVKKKMEREKTEQKPAQIAENSMRKETNNKNNNHEKNQK